LENMSVSQAESTLLDVIENDLRENMEAER
jgi:hypothetical protein